MPLAAAQALPPDPANLNDRSADAERFLVDLIRRRFADCAGPAVVAVGGPGGTGKSTLCEALAGRLGDCGVIRLDDYRTPRRERAARMLFGPHPRANRYGLLTGHLRCLRAGRPFDRPVYDPVTGAADRTERYAPRRINLLDGETSTADPLQPLVDLVLFVDADIHTQWRTRLTRDVSERGYTHHKAIATFVHSNLREFGRHLAHTRARADVCLRRGPGFELRVEAVRPGLLDGAAATTAPAAGG